MDWKCNGSLISQLLLFIIKAPGQLADAGCPLTASWAHCQASWTSPRKRTFYHYIVFERKLDFILLLRTPIENKFGPTRKLNNTLNDIKRVSHCWSNRYHQIVGDLVPTTPPRSMEIYKHTVSKEVWRQNIIQGMLHQNVKIESFEGTKQLQCRGVFRVNLVKFELSRFNLST